MSKTEQGRRTIKRMCLKSLLLFLSSCLLSSANVKGSDLGRSSAIQMDVTAAKSITICTGLKRAIACRDGSNIAITHAFWGRISDKVCPSDDGDPVTDCEGAEETLDLVRGYCEGKAECVLQARHQYLQKNNTHHCPGVNKYLVVNYTCIPDSKGVVLCDSEEAVIECKAGWKIEVTDAFWGTRANTKYCSTGMQGMECDNGPYAKSYLKKKCDGSSTCLVKATTDELEDKKSKSVCQNLLYLLLNYACKSSYGVSGSAKADADDENEATVENKLLADTSSKELMGLLEKHLNELQTKSSYHDKDESAKSDDEKVRDTKTSAKKPTSTSGATKQGKTAKKQAKADTSAQPVAPVPQPQANAAGYVRSLTSTASENETPALDIKETDASKKSQETVPAAASAEKKQILPKASIETPAEEPSYEISEPGTVKSILARAKEVLKSLDEEKEEANATIDGDKSMKKSDISRKSANEKNKQEAAQSVSVKQVAKLAASLVKTANKLRSHNKYSNNTKNSAQQSKGAQYSLGQVTQQRSVKKPKPGPKKNGLSATGPGRAGVGNTP